MPELVLLLELVRLHSSETQRSAEKSFPPPASEDRKDVPRISIMRVIRAT